MSSTALRARCCAAPGPRSAPSLSLRRRAPPARAAAATEATTTATATTSPSAAAANAVRAFYDAYNRRDLARLESLLAADVVYSDLVYPEPKKGRPAVMAWLSRVSEGAPRDLAFVIEGLAAGEEQVAGDGGEAPNTTGVGVKWHVALLDGQKKKNNNNNNEAGASSSSSSSSSPAEPIIFPFSRGCSYVEVNSSGLIVRVRDVVEPSSKPGDLALSLLGGLAPLIRAVGPTAAERAGTVVDRRADAMSNVTPATAPSSSPSSSSASLPPTALALWLFYAGYLAFAMLSDLPPGPPAYATQPQVLLETLHESVNLLWIAEALSKLGLPMLVPVVPSHPVSEATFNFAVTWAALFVPLMFSDARGKRVARNGLWALAVVFVTNLFLTPWMALREGVGLQEAEGGQDGKASPSPAPAPGRQTLPGYSRALGFFAAGAGALCVGWALAGRPEMGGDLADRWRYVASFAGGGNRVFWAFWLDFALFSVWQASMLAGAPAGYRFLPFAGMAAWLIVRGGGEEETKGESERA
jgi:hypothetical protein